MRPLAFDPPPRWGPVNKTVNIILLASLLFGGVTVPEAWAATLTVSTAGANVGNCQGSPCRTITYALGQASGTTADVINVGAGTYNAAGGETFPLALKDGVAIIGDTVAPGTRTISAPVDTDVFYSNGTSPLSATTRLAGFTLTHDAPSDTNIVLHFEVVDQVLSPRIDHNVFPSNYDTNWEYGIHADDASGAGTFTPTIDNNTFNTIGYALSVYDSSGGTDTFSPTIDHNTFTGCADPIYYQISTSAAGTAAGEVRNNTSTGTTSADVNYLLDPHGTPGLSVTPSIHDNTFAAADGADNIYAGGHGWGVNGNFTFSPTIFNNSLTAAGGSNVDIDSLWVWGGTGNVTFAPVVRDNPTMSATENNFAFDGDFSDVSGTVSISPTVTGNTMTGAGSNAISLSIWGLSPATGYQGVFSPTIADNTITASGAASDGIHILVSESSSTAGQFVSDLTISGNTISGANNGISFFLSSFGYVSGFDVDWTIANNTITSPGSNGISISASYMYLDMDAGAWDVTIAGNTITDATAEGIYVKYSSFNDAAHVDQSLLIAGNTVTGSKGLAGVELDLTDQSGLLSNDIRLVDNVIQNGTGDGLKIYSADWNASPSYNGNAILVSCNTITGNGGNGVLETSSGSWMDPPGDYGGGNRNSPGGNIFMDNGGEAYDFNNQRLDEAKAENNWWGQNTGPAAGQTNGLVDADPWLGAAPTVTLVADLADAVVVDVAPAGPSVGDTLEYTATITPGAGSCGDTGLTFTVPVPANTTLVPDSITTTSGTVTGTSPITVTNGSVSAGETITVTWKVVANSGTEVNSQGTLSATRSATILSNDPATPLAGDPTVTVFQQEREAVPTLGEWGLIALTGLLLILGVAFLRRRKLAAAGLVLLLAAGAAWAGAATQRKADRNAKKGKTTTVATVKNTSVSGDTVTLALSDGSSLTVPKHSLKVRQHRNNPDRARLQGLRPEDRLIEQSKIMAERQAQRAARQAERQAMSPEQRAAERKARRIEVQRAQRARASEHAAPVALLAKGTPVLVTVDRDAQGRIQRARVETYASEPEARLALQGRQARKEKTAIR